PPLRHRRGRRPGPRRPHVDHPHGRRLRGHLRDARSLPPAFPPRPRARPHPHLLLHSPHLGPRRPLHRALAGPPDPRRNGHPSRTGWRRLLGPRRRRRRRHGLPPPLPPHLHPLHPPPPGL